MPLNDLQDMPAPDRSPERLTNWRNWKRLRLWFNDAYYTSAYGNFATLISDLGSRSVTVYVNSAVSITSNLTIPSNISIVVLKGGSFAISTGVTLTMAIPQAGSYQIYSGDGDVVFSPGGTVLLRWFGAPGINYLTDDGPAIQKATDSIESSGGEVFFGYGLYASSIPLTIPTSNVIWRASGPDRTRLAYTGSAFDDFITIVDGNNEWAKILNIGLLGGTFLHGKARYIIRADNFNAGCEISGCLIRDGVGLVKITNGYLGKFSHNVLVGTTPNRTLAGITHDQWLEVYGTGCAPVMLQVMNNSEIDHNYMLRVGSEESSGVKGYAAVIIDGAGISVHNLGIENSSTYNSGGTDYVLSVKKTLVLKNFIGNINAYFENCAPDEELVQSIGTSHATLLDTQAYNCAVGGVMFRNSGLGPMKVVGGKAWRINCPALYAPSTSGTTNQEGVYFERFSVVSGRRLTDAAINAQTNNVFDSFGSYNVLGTVDGVDLAYSVDRLFTPKILDGYAVTSASDSDGPYILVTGGIFLNEAGETVQNKHYCDDGATLAVNKLRPTTVSNYYRVWVGKAGQVFLTKSVSAFTTGYGNWIAEFSTDGAGAIGALTANPRLSINGAYPFGNSRLMFTASAVPASGRFEVDDIVWIASSTTATPAFHTCTVAGSPGTWVACDNFAAKSLAAVNLNLSGVLQRGGTQILTTQQTGMGATLGAATAGAAYTAAEQTMLQAVYDKMVSMETKLKTHGLLAT